MIFELIRKTLCPFGEIEKYIPKKGKILDVGCGHGIFAKILTGKSRERQVLGIDPATTKINIAKRNSGPRLQFRECYLEDHRGNTYHAISIIDVLYLIPEGKILKMLQHTKKLLAPGGRLIISEINPASLIFHALISIEEWVMIKLLKITFAGDGNIYLRHRNEYQNMLKKSGYKINQSRNITGVMSYPHYIIIASINPRARKKKPTHRNI